jgi:hypothetical protein
MAMASPLELQWYVQNRFLTGNEDQFELYMFEGQLLHDEVLRAKRLAKNFPGFVEVMRVMSKPELDALRKRVSRALAFADRSK